MLLSITKKLFCNVFQRIYVPYTENEAFVYSLGTFD